MKPAVIIAIALGVCGVAVLGFYGRELFPLASAKSRGNAPQTLIAEVRGLREELTKLQSREPRQIVINQQAADGAPPTAGAQPETAEESQEQKLERIERHAQASAESLDRRLLSEARDLTWGNESLAQADQAVASRLPGARLLASTCASTVCRVVLSQETEGQLREIGPALAETAPFDQGTFYRYDRESHPPKATLYVIRRGHDLQELTGADTAHLAP